VSRWAWARIAGVLFLLYIATGLVDLAVFRGATGGVSGAAALASLAEHAPLLRATVVLTLLQAVYALVLGVALFALTRDTDLHVAVLGLSFRVAEGVTGAVGTVGTLGLLSVATGTSAAPPADAAAARALGAYLLNEGGSGAAAFCFAMGSTLFAWLFLRGRSIPVWLAWLGVVASLLLVVLLPATHAGFLEGPVTGLMWIPMAVFEVVLAGWLLIKGVRGPAVP